MEEHNSLTEYFRLKGYDNQSERMASEVLRRTDPDRAICKCAYCNARYERSDTKTELCPKCEYARSQGDIEEID